MKIKAIIFDFDGTLVDSEEFHFKCWNEALESFDIKLQYDDYIAHYAGMPTPLNAQRIVKMFNLPISAKDLSGKNEKVTEIRLKSDEIKFMPYAIDSLKYFSGLKIPMYLVTGSPRNDVDFILEITGIKRFFEFTITRTEVKKSKPDPESYLKVINKSNFSIENILVFEDSAGGVESAKSANLNCFAIQKNIELQNKLIAADKIFEDLNQAINFIAKNNLI